MIVQNKSTLTEFVSVNVKVLLLLKEIFYEYSDWKEQIGLHNFKR